MLKHLVDPLHPTREWPSDIKLKCEIGQSTLVSLSPRGSYLAAGLADGTLVVLDADTFSVIFRYREHAMPLLGIHWSANAQYIVTAGSDWQIGVWDMQTRTLVRMKQLEFSPTAVSFCEASPTSQLTELQIAIVCGAQLYIYSLSSTSQTDALLSWDSIPDADVATISCVAFLTPQIVVCGTTKGNMHVYERGKVVKTLKLSTGSLRAFAYANSRQILAAACSDRSVRVFYLAEALANTASGGSIDTARVEIGHRFTDLGLQSQWNSLAFSQDGEYLYAGSDIRHGVVSIWNVLTRFAVRQLRGNSERIASLQFDQQRGMLVGAGKESGAIFVWRADPPKEAWASLIHDFEHIPDIEVYQEKEADWDLPDRQIRVSVDTEVDVWTLPEPVDEIVIPIDL